MKTPKSLAKDPICGMMVDKSTGLHAECDGKTFYFCSEDCRKRFLSTSSCAKPQEKSGCGCCG